MTAYLDKLNELGFVLFYPTDETSGTTATDAIGALDGTYTDSPTLNQTSLALNREYASIDCAGGAGGGYIDRADDAAFQANTFTFCILASVDVLENDRAFANYRSISNNGGWTIESRADGSVRAYAYAAGAFRSAFSSAGVCVAGEAAFWTLLYDGDYVRVYKNGTQVAVSSQFTGVMSYGTGTRSLRIGRHITSGTRINGKLQGPAFADYALSASEVEDLYLSTTLYGGIASSLQPLAAALAGSQTQSGTIAASLRPLTSALVGVMPPSGGVAATLVALTAALTAESRTIGGPVRGLAGGGASALGRGSGFASATASIPGRANSTTRPRGGSASPVVR